METKSRLRQIRFRKIYAQNSLSHMVSSPIDTQKSHTASIDKDQ